MRRGGKEQAVLAMFGEAPYGHGTFGIDRITSDFPVEAGAAGAT